MWFPRDTYEIYGDLRGELSKPRPDADTVAKLIEELVDAKLSEHINMYYHNSRPDY